MNLGKYTKDDADAIAADLNQWANFMHQIRQPVPDFWSELNTAERLGEWLAAKGYRKATEVES